MSKQKSELKKLVYHDLGMKLDDLLDGANVLAAQCEGGKTALSQFSRNVASLQDIAKKELDDGTIPDLETLNHVSRFIARAMHAADNAARHWENREIAARGSVTFGDKAVKLVKTLHDQEKAKVDAFVEALSQAEIPHVPEDGPVRRPVGVRPGESVAAQRRAENEKSVQVQETKGKNKTTRKKKKVTGRASNAG